MLKKNSKTDLQYRSI